MITSKSTRIRTLIVAACALSSPSVFSQAESAKASNSAYTSQVAIAQITTYDAAFPRLTATVDYWLGVPGLPTDFRKHSAVVDMRGYVLTNAQRTRLVALRAEAARSYLGRDWPGVVVAMNEALREIALSADRLRAVQDYWQFRALDIYRQRAWREAFIASRIPRDYEPRIAEIEQKLQAKIRVNDFAGAVEHEVAEIAETYLAALREARLGRPNGVLSQDPMRRQRTRRCTRGTVAGVVREDEGVTRDSRVNEARSANAFDFYPRTAAQLAIGGQVDVKIRVGADGCAEWAEALNWSAPPVLIQAALDWVIEGAGFIPALRDGQPVADELIYIANFGVQPVVR